MGTVSPKVQAVEYGGVIYINCYSNYKIEWMFKQPKWHKRAIKSRYTISISPAIYSDTGNYTLALDHIGVGIRSFHLQILLMFM